MAKDLIIERQEVGVPPTPVIVKDLYSLDGGVEIHSNSVPVDYEGGIIKGDYPKVLKAGHIVYLVGDTWWLAEVGKIDDVSTFTAGALIDGVPSLIGVLKNDAVAHFDEGGDPFYYGSILLIGAVDCDYMPAKVGKNSIFGRKVTNNVADENPEACNITFLNRKF